MKSTAWGREKKESQRERERISVNNGCYVCEYHNGWHTQNAWTNSCKKLHYSLQKSLGHNSSSPTWLRLYGIQMYPLGAMNTWHILHILSRLVTGTIPTIPTGENWDLDRISVQPPIIIVANCHNPTQGGVTIGLSATEVSPKWVKNRRRRRRKKRRKKEEEKR